MDLLPMDNKSIPNSIPNLERQISHQKTPIEDVTPEDFKLKAYADYFLKERETQFIPLRELRRLHDFYQQILETLPHRPSPYTCDWTPRDEFSRRVSQLKFAIEERVEKISKQKNLVEKHFDAFKRFSLDEQTEILADYELCKDQLALSIKIQSEKGYCITPPYMLKEFLLHYQTQIERLSRVVAETREEFDSNLRFFEKQPSTQFLSDLTKRNLLDYCLKKLAFEHLELTPQQVSSYQHYVNLLR